VAIEQVVEMERTPSGDYELRLRSDARVPMSRGHKARFARMWR